jgi:protein-tyrosine phosphatase
MVQESTAERPAPVSPYIEARETGAYRIDWGGESPEVEVEIFAGPTPDRIDFTRVLARDRSGSIEVTPDFSGRAYFAIRVAGALTLLASRNVPMAGVSNFRDLGGYRAGPGPGSIWPKDRPARTTRWGLLYRSSDFNELCDSDRQLLRGLGLRRVIDFRSHDESEKRPNRFGVQLAIEEFPIPIDPGSSGGFRSMMGEGDFSPNLMIEAMATMNRVLVRDHSDDYRQMFDRLLEAEGAPAVVNCVSGKDRTGVASALILMALGVDRETILRDYLLTNVYLQVEDRIKEGLENFARYTTRKIDPEIISPMYDARQPFITAAMDEMDRLHGSGEAYLRESLGFDDARFERLHELYLD